MPKKQTLTVAELKNLLIAHFIAEQDKQAKLRARFQQELGNEIRVEKPEINAIKKKYADWIYGTIARRLKRNRRTTPLLSSRDFVRAFPLLIEGIAESAGDELEKEEREMLEKFMKTMFKNILEMMDTVVPLNKDPYKEYWRWISIVLDLASERGVLPTELFTLEGATDEITRRTFTKKQFIAHSKRVTKKFTSVNMLKKIVVQPILDTVVAEFHVDEEGQREIEQNLETDLMPQLNETVEENKVVINAWLAEEIERIYAE